MNALPQTDTLTVLYDGECPLCRREIAHVQGLARRQGDTALCFVDISGGAASNATGDATLAVERADGTRLSSAAAFVAMWSRLPGWRWLARLARPPGMLALLELEYLRFLRLRPVLQTFALRWEPAASPTSVPSSTPLSTVPTTSRSAVDI